MRSSKVRASMVVVSATMYFPEQARAMMRQISAADKQPDEEWQRMRKIHKLGDPANQENVGVDARNAGFSRAASTVASRASMSDFILATPAPMSWRTHPV
jgi:hypothetical protein